MPGTMLIEDTYDDIMHGFNGFKVHSEEGQKELEIIINLVCNMKHMVDDTADLLVRSQFCFFNLEEIVVIG